TFLGLMIGDVGDAQFSNLFPLVEKLYDLDYIDLSLEGDFEDFMEFYNENRKNGSGSNYKLQTLNGIYSSADFCEESEVKTKPYQSPLNEPKVIQMPVDRVKVN